jgi:hypothetical protein
VISLAATNLLDIKAPFSLYGDVVYVRHPERESSRSWPDWVSAVVAVLMPIPTKTAMMCNLAGTK